MNKQEMNDRGKGMSLNERQMSALDSEEHEQLSKKGLFIVGSARSGTTILCRCLNTSNDIYLLEEANLYSTDTVGDFVRHFNDQHVRFENYRTKGTFIPPSTAPEDGLTFLNRISRCYRYIGEKVAFGASDDPIQESFFMFQSKYFYWSAYVLIIRNPIEEVWSASMMFPEVDKKPIIMSWLKTVKIILDIYQSFPTAYLLFFEDLNSDTIAKVGQLLGLDIGIPDGTIRQSYRRSTTRSDNFPAALREYKILLDECYKIYLSLKSRFSSERLAYAGSENQVFFTSAARYSIEKLLEIVDYFDVNDPHILQAINFNDTLSAARLEQGRDRILTLSRESLQEATDMLTMLLGSKSLVPMAKSWCFYNRGVLHRNLQKTELARADFEQAVKDNPRHSDARKQLRESTEYLLAPRAAEAKRLVHSGQFSTALLVFQELCNELPDSGEYNYYHGFCLHMLNQNLDKALQCYDLARAGGYSEFWVRYNRGILYMALGNLEQARADLERAAELDPEHPGARQQLGELTSRMSASLPAETRSEPEAGKGRLTEHDGSVYWERSAAQSLQFMIDILPSIRKLLIGWPWGQTLSVVDIGASTAAGTNLLATLNHTDFYGTPMRVDAMEIRQEWEMHARRMFPLVNYIVADIFKYELDKKWDLVVCSHVIKHLTNPRDFILELQRRANLYVVVYAPYREANLLYDGKGHLFSVDDEFVDSFDPVEKDIIESPGWRHPVDEESRCVLFVLQGGDRKS